MKASWKFLAGLGVGLPLTFGLTLAAFYLNLGVPSRVSRWAFDINQKKHRLCQQSTSPKILLVGGSATLFGISAGEIERQTGRRTINLGTHASLGTAYLLHLARQIAQPGDTVLLGFEYELYNHGPIGPAWADMFCLDYLVARDPAYFRQLPFIERWNVFMLTSNRRLISGLKGRFQTERPIPEHAFGVYNVSRINDWGDLTGHSAAARPAAWDGVEKWKAPLKGGLPEHPQAFPVIASFCEWARTNHVRVLATYPNLRDNPDYRTRTAQRTAQTIQVFFASLNVPVIGDYTEALLPPDQFFDTHYHPTQEAAIRRTQRLASELKPYLEQPSAAALSRRDSAPSR